MGRYAIGTIQAKQETFSSTLVCRTRNSCCKDVVLCEENGIEWRHYSWRTKRGTCLHLIILKYSTAFLRAKGPRLLLHCTTKHNYVQPLDYPLPALPSSPTLLAPQTLMENCATEQHTEEINRNKSLRGVSVYLKWTQFLQKVMQISGA